MPGLLKFKKTLIEHVFLSEQEWEEMFKIEN